MKKDLVGVVLAGGIGTRFWPLTTDKILFPFLGKPYISHTSIDSLPAEITRLVIVANKDNYRSLQSLKYPVPHTIITQQYPRGMADALITAGSAISDASLLIIIADHLVNPGLFDAVIHKAKTSGAFGVLPGWKTTQYFPGGYLDLNGQRIIRICEKPGEGKEPSQFVYVSGQYIEDANLLLDQLKKTTSDKDDIYEKALTALAASTQIIMEPYTGRSSSLKYPWQVLDVMDDLLNEKVREYRGENVQIKDYVTIDGQVYIGNNVKIFENTKISGPCYIGDNSIIGNNNLIRASHIGSGSVTGFNTDITRSYIGDDCWFHSNYLGDSILEGNIGIGSGTVLANLRLDEREIYSNIKNEKCATNKRKLGAIIGRDVRIGVNSSIMPGVKIGSTTIIGAGVIVDKDILDHSLYYRKNDCIIKSNTQEISSDRDVFRNKIG